MPTPPKPPFVESDEDGVNFERVVFFSDTVFAIAITLLALEIRLPEVEVDALPQAILALLPEIAVYALSFLIVGVYWVSHHRMFQYIVRYDYTLIWLNLFYVQHTTPGIDADEGGILKVVQKGARCPTLEVAQTPKQEDHHDSQCQGYRADL